MKGVISVVIFVPTLQIFIFSVETYKFICPLQAHWKLRAKEKCNSTQKYFCLYNKVKGKYVEGCNGPDWDRKGCKRIYVGDFSRGDCIPERFQPFKYWTNESMSDCIYAKSLCSEEGQIVYTDDSRKDDRSCRCDYKRNYSFIITPRHLCYCIPTEEDCSCYIKSCPVNFTLSADYECTQISYQEKPKCTEISKYHEPGYKTTGILMGKNETLLNEQTPTVKWKESTEAAILFCLCFIHIIVASGFSLIVLYSILNSDKLQLLKGYILRIQTDTDKPDGEQLVKIDTIDENNSEVCESTSVEGKIELTTDEVNFLRIIHLLFRVAWPVVRMVFNREIQPNQLRKMLDKKRRSMEKQYRSDEKKIHNYQWDLLYGHVKGKTVTSEDFDIRIMIYLLRTLANIEVGDLYPVPTDTKISAMLSRIKHIRNVATQSVEGKFSEKQFNQYWDDIGQAVFSLVSSNTFDIADDGKKTQLTGRLLVMNPICFDDNKLCLFIDMSEKYPSILLKQIISEYCNLNQTVIEDVLRKEKHKLYHKRIKAEACCKCPTEYSTYIKSISEKQWEALFKMNENSFSHSCTFDLTKCYERFVPKKINTSDLSVTMSLILNIPHILKYFISRLCVNGFDKFLMRNQHTIYHSMEKKKCCMCNKDPTEKILIDKEDWDKLYIKGDKTSCKLDTENCCCQYSERKGIKYLDLDGTLLSKIVFVAGPIGTLNKIGQDAFLFFLSWTVDESSLRKALKKLLKITKDKTICPNLLHQISSSYVSQSDKKMTNKREVREWISRHFRHQKATTDPPLQILVLDKDGLSVKRAQVPKDFPFPHRTRKFTDITSEENRFLLVVLGLTKIVNTVIKNQFETLCSEEVFNQIRMEIYEEQTAPHVRKRMGKDDKNSLKKRIYLTTNQQQRLFSPNKDESKNLDLKLMIYILKRITEAKRDYVNQLDVINNIRKEITQSSSGVLDEKRFLAIMQLIRKALLHFGEKSYEEKLSNLQHITNILDLR